jgi:predicted nucleotide-binding protein
MKDPKHVFLVHGRNEPARDAVVLFLRALQLDSLDFDEVRNSLGGSPFIGDIIRTGMQLCKCIVILLTPDEYSCLRPSLCTAYDADNERHRWQARSNVLIEAGMALAIDHTSTILVLLGDVSVAYDFAGRHFIRLNNSLKAREQLPNALIGAGCEIGKETPGWYDTRIAGDFDSAISTLPEVSIRTPFR